MTLLLITIIIRTLNICPLIFSEYEKDEGSSPSKSLNPVSVLVSEKNGTL